MDERRQLPRWTIKKEVKVWLPQYQEFSHCTVEDINLKGMCLAFNKRISQEQPVKISLSLDNDFDFMKLEVNLSWVKEDQGRFIYGMSYNKIMDPDKDRIDQYITNNCFQQFKDKWWAV